MLSLLSKNLVNELDVWSGLELKVALVLTSVNHLIIKHDQIPFVLIKIGNLLQSRSLDDFNVWHGD